MTSRDLRSGASGKWLDRLKGLFVRRQSDPLAELRSAPTGEERERLVMEQFEEEMGLALAHGVHEVSAWFNAASLRGRALDQLVHDGHMTLSMTKTMVMGRPEYLYTYTPTARGRGRGALIHPAQNRPRP